LPQIIKKSNTTYSFDLPLYVSNYQGLPANSSVISLIERNLSAQLISAQENENLTFSISKNSYGLIVIFMKLNTTIIKKIQNGSSVISFFSEFKFGAMIDLATGIAGSTIFAGLSSQTTSGNISTTPGLNSSQTNLNSLPGLLSSLSYFLSTIAGRALTVIVAGFALIYYSYNIQELRKKRRKK